MHEREAWVLRHAPGPVMPVVIRLAAGQIPGDDFSEDVGWATSIALGRRQVLAIRSAVSTLDWPATACG
jgi:hypothetical protein